MSDYRFLKKGARGSYNTEINGYEFTSFVILDDVEGDDDITIGRNALNDSRIEPAGFDLGGIASDLQGCWLRKKDYEIIGRTKATPPLAIVKVILHFQSSKWGILQVDAGNNLNQIQTNLNIDGEPILLEYNYPADYGGTEPSEEEERLQGQTKEQGGTVTVQMAENTRVYTVREQIDPLIAANIYGDTLNETAWFGGEPGTWLCSIDGKSDNSGVSVVSPATWVNRYSFQFKPDGWDPEAVYSDVLTGEPVPVELDDPVNPDAMKKVISYRRTEFNVLFPSF
jgi:hypothetical protein